MQTRRREYLNLALILIATLSLHLPVVVYPRLLFDDFEILQDSWDWPTTVRNLWRPHNEHAMPLGRLLAYVVLHADDDITTLPLRGAIQCALSLPLAVGLLYLFVRRELGRPAPALLAAALYGVSVKYHQTVFWFAANLWMFGFITLLLGLLAAQRWQQTGRWHYLVLCTMWSALAPAWYAGGILAGPICVLYLLPQPNWRRRALAMTPILGALIFLAISLPQNAQRIIHAQHYRGKTALEAFDPVFGIVSSMRAVVDLLIFSPSGSDGAICRLPWALFVFAGVAVLTAWWNRHAPRRLILPALGLILGHNWLTFAARADWGYMELIHWSRYHMAPWLGMVLLFVNGWSRRFGSPGFEPTRTHSAAIILLVALLLAVQLRIVWRPEELDLSGRAEQRAALRRIAEVERRCQLHQIGAEDAKAALLPLKIPLSNQSNGWSWLRGGDSPRPRPLAEVRQMLTD